MITYFFFRIFLYSESLWTRFSEKPWHLLAFWYIHNLQVIFFIQNLINCWFVRVKIFSNHFYYIWKIYLKILRLFYIQNRINCWTCVLICNQDLFWWILLLLWWETHKFFLGSWIWLYGVFFSTLNDVSHSRYLYLFIFKIKLMVELSIIACPSAPTIHFHIFQNGIQIESVKKIESQNYPNSIREILAWSYMYHH